MNPFEVYKQNANKLLRRKIREDFIGLLLDKQDKERALKRMELFNRLRLEH